MKDIEQLKKDLNSTSSDYVERYGLLMQASSECTLDFNLATSELYMSQSFKTVFGIEPISVDENLNLFISHIHPEDAKQVEDIYQDIINNVNKEVFVNIEYRFRRADGEYAYVRDKLIILRDKDSKAYRVLNVIKDVTSEYFYKVIELIEREVMEMSMKEDASLAVIITKYITKIEALFPNMKASVLRIKNNKIENLASPSLPVDYINAINGLTIGNNKGSCGTAAYTKEKVIVEDIQNDIRWADYKELASHFNFGACWSQPIFNTRQEVVATFANYYQTCKKPDEWEAYAIDRSQKLLSIIISNFEYIDRIQNSNQKFKFVNQLTNDAIYEWNLDESTIVWGEGFKRIFGHEYESEVVYSSKHWNELVHVEDFDRIQNAIDTFISDRDTFNWEVEYRFIKSDKTFAYVKEMGHIVRDKEGRAITIYGLLRDITEEVLNNKTKQLQEDIALIFKEKNSLKEALNKLLDLIIEESDFKTAELWVYSKDRNHINLISKKAKNEVYNSFFELSKNITRFNRGEGIPGRILNEKKCIVSADLAHTDYFIRKEEAAKAGLISAAGVPINYKLEAVGVLMVCNSSVIDEKNHFLRILDSLQDFLGAEIKRKEEEEEMYLLIESSPDILAIVAPNGHFTKVNPTFCELLGYTAEEITSRPFIEFIHPDDLKNTKNIYNESVVRAEKKAKNFINRYRRKDRSYAWISWSTSETFGDESYAFAYGHDVTDIIELQNLLRAATSLSKVGGWELDLSTKNNGKLYWSNITKEIMGVESDFAPTLAEALEFYNEESKQKIKYALKELLENNTEFDLELLCQFKDASTKWVRVIGKSERMNNECVKIYGSYQDINKQKLNELTISESEKRYADIFHLSPLPMWIIDLSNFNFLDVNNAALEQYGYTREEFLSMNVGDLRPIEDREKVFELLNNNMHYENYEHIGIWTHLKKNGEILKVDIRSKSISYEEKKARIILATDVTERLKHLEALQSQNNKLKEIAWMQSHIVRAPLSRLMGLVEMVLDKDTDEVNRAIALNYFKQSADELDQIINDIVIKAKAIEK